MNSRIGWVAGAFAALGLATAWFILRDTGGFTLVVISILLAADLVGVYFVMQFGLSHDGLPHVDSAENSASVQKLIQMNEVRLAKVEAGRARAALTAGDLPAAVTVGEVAPKRTASRRRAAPTVAEANTTPAAE